MSKPGLPDDASLPAPATVGTARSSDDGQPTAPLAERLRQHALHIQSLRRKAPAVMAVTGTQSNMSSNASALLMRVLAALPDGERRRHPRLVINASVFHDQHPHGPIATTRNIGKGGMLLSFHTLGPDIIQFMALGGTLTVEGLGTVTARMTRLEEDAAFLAFEGPLDATFDAALRTLTAQMQQRHAPYLTLAGVLAEQMQYLLVGQIINGDAKLGDILTEHPGRRAVAILPQQSMAALQAMLQSEVETLGNVSRVMALHSEGVVVCEVRREHPANCAETQVNPVLFVANNAEPGSEFVAEQVVSDVLDWSHADIASLAFAARISPVPAVQFLSLQSPEGSAAYHHLASSPVHVLGRRWGAAAVMYQLQTEAIEAQ